MAKKMEEQLNFDIDDSMSEIRTEIPKNTIEETNHTNSSKRIIDNTVCKTSCLRNERITIKHVNKPSGMITNPKHALFGGMAETATRTFVVPILSSGAYKQILTEDERIYLEDIMGLEYQTLSPYKKENNYWNSDNPAATVTLKKQDNYLNLKDPEQYIKYKILLANNDFIASSIQELEDHPKATYQYVLISEGDESKSAGIKLSAKKLCYKELGKLNNDVDTLRVIIETLEGRPLAPTSDINFLETKADDLITADSKTFLKVITDPLLSTKVLIKKSIEIGTIGKKGDGYYLQDGTPLCELNEDPTLNIAAKYLNAPKHQEVKFMLEAKLK